MLHVTFLGLGGDGGYSYSSLLASTISRGMRKISFGDGKGTRCSVIIVFDFCQSPEEGHLPPKPLSLP